MNIKILEEKENNLLKRKEFLLEVDSPDKTPTNQELKKELVSFLKAKEELIAIKGINQIFGKRTCKVEVNVYKDETSLKEIEPKQKEKKEKPKEQAPAEQKPAEAPKPEAKPKEEKKE